jgi:hypothetical protein
LKSNSPTQKASFLLQPVAQQQLPPFLQYTIRPQIGFSFCVRKRFSPQIGFLLSNNKAIRFLLQIGIRLCNKTFPLVPSSLRNQYEFRSPLPLPHCASQTCTTTTTTTTTAAEKESQKTAETSPWISHTRPQRALQMQ